ncbi:MAG TPA: amidohydrolase family protein [candidate division Zixibacteria bacterium]|nr:amidohydrolase family protein [candidate division Zixibacteria bacterium]
MSTGYPIIDADGHVLERDAEIREFLEGKYREYPHFQTYSYFPSLDGWNRGFGVPGKVHETPAPKWIEFLDELGVHTTVLYPTAGLALGLIQNPEWACVLARAYNSWIAERFVRHSPRLKAVALLPVHEPLEAAKELERARRLGLVGGLLPAVTVLYKGYGHPDFDPIYQAAERLGMPLAVHGAPSRNMGFDFFDKFLQVHTLEHPFAILVQFTHMLFEGVFERFPKLRVAFLEAGSGWIPYMMDRMDEEFEKPYRFQAPLLRKKPSEYIRSGQVWVTCEVEERALVQVLRQFNPRCVMWPSDYPHERLPDMFRRDIPEFLERPDIDDTAKKAILHDNPIDFYGLKL